MYSLDLLLEAALLCLSGSGLVSRSIEWVRVSSDIKLCSLRCDKDGIYTLDRDSSLPILDFACSDNSTNIYSDYQQRLSLNVSAGCCTITNAQPSDTGTYELSFYGETKKKILVGATKYQVIEPVSVTNITTNRSGENVALSVSYSGEEATVLWTWNGGDLPERHQLSDSNKTLTVPSTDTGTFTVLVSNPVSHTSTHYNLTLPDAACRSRSRNIGIVASLVFIGSLIGGFFYMKEANKRSYLKARPP